MLTPQKDETVANEFTRQAGATPVQTPLPVADFSGAQQTPVQEDVQAPPEEDEEDFATLLKRAEEEVQLASQQETPVPEEDFADLLEAAEDEVGEHLDLDNIVENYNDVIQQWRIYRGLDQSEYDDQDVADDYINEMRGLDNNLGDAAMHLYNVEFGNISEEEKNALRVGLEHWEKVPWGSQGVSGFFGNVWQSVTSPETVVGLGVGKLAGKGAGLGMRAAMKELLAVGAVEAGAGVGHSLIRQNVEKDVKARDDISLTEAGIEGGIAATVSMFPGLASGAVRAIRGKNAVKEGVEEAAETLAKKGDDPVANDPNMGKQTAPDQMEFDFGETPKDSPDAANVPSDVPEKTLSETADEVLNTTQNKEFQIETGKLERVNGINPKNYLAEDDVMESFMRTVRENGPVNKDAASGAEVDRMVREQGLEETLKKQDAEYLARAENDEQIAVTREALQMLRIATVSAVKDYEDLAKHVEVMRPKSKEYASEFNALVAKRNEAFLKKETLIRRTQQSADNAGKLLQAFQMIARQGLDADIAIEDLARIMGRDIETVSKMVAKGKTSEEATKSMFKRADRMLSRSVDKFMELWYNGILGSLSTTTVNAFGSVYSNFMRGVEGYGEAAAGNVIRAFGGQSDATFRGANARVSAMFHGIKDATAIAKYSAMYTDPRKALNAKLDAAKDIGDVDEVRKIQRQIDNFINTGRSDIVENSVREAAWGGVTGGIIRMPGKLMAASDAWNKHIARQGALAAAAEAKAFKGGLKPGTAEHKKFISDVMANPDKEMKAYAKRQMETVTFQNSNTLTSTIEAAQNAKWGGPIVRFIIPFARTPVNIISYGIARTPLGILSPNKAISLEERAGRVMMGTAGIYLFADLYERGYFTGYVPGDWKDRMAANQAGYEEFALNGTLGLSRFDPIAWTIGLAIAYVDAKRAMENMDVRDQMEGEAALNTIVNELAKGFQHLVFDRSYLDALGGAFSMYEKASTGNLDAWGELEKGVGRTLSGVVPGWVKDIGAATDPYRRKAQTIPEQIMRRIPYLRQQLPPAVDAFGYAIEEADASIPNAPGVGEAVPVWKRNVPSHAVKYLEMMMDHGVGVEPAPTKIDGVELDAKDRAYIDWHKGVMYQNEFAKNYKIWDNRSVTAQGKTRNKQDMERLQRAALEEAKFTFIKDLYAASVKKDASPEIVKKAQKHKASIERAKHDGILDPTLYYVDENNIAQEFDVGNFKKIMEKRKEQQQ